MIFHKLLLFDYNGSVHIFIIKILKREKKIIFFFEKY